jgi:hypothetical protein
MNNGGRVWHKLPWGCEGILLVNYLRSYISYWGWVQVGSTWFHIKTLMQYEGFNNALANQEILEYSQRTGSYPPWNRKHTIPATKRLGVTPSIMTTLFKRNRHIFWLLVSRPIPIPKVTVWVNLDHHTVSPNMIEIWLKHDTVWLKIDHQILVSAKSYMFETTKQSHFPNWISGSFPSWPTGAEFLWCLVQLQGNSHVQLWPLVM